MYPTIPQKGDLGKAGNYRDITLTSKYTTYCYKIEFSHGLNMS